jgi:DNA-binding NarL/FixJ family response regulator
VTQDRKILALVRDLMFSGRISAEARAAGVLCRIIRESAKLTENEAGELLLVDLTLPEAIPAATAWRKASGLPVIGFAPHTDSQIISQAETAGFDQVLTRGRFVQVLPQRIRNQPQSQENSNE